MKTINKLKIFIVLILFTLVIVFYQSYLQIDTNEIRDWILSFGLFAPIIYIILYTVRPFILFPSSVLSIVGGLAFGALWGTIYTIIGAAIGALLSFIVAKKLGGNIARKDWKGNAQKIKLQLEKKGFLYILTLRLIPILNFDLISYLAAISKVRTSSFFFGTLVGIIPATFAYNFLGSSLLSGDFKIIIIAIIVFFLIILIPLLFNKRIFS